MPIPDDDDAQRLFSRQKSGWGIGALTVTGMRCREGERDTHTHTHKPVFCSMSARDKIKYIPKDGQHQEPQKEGEAKGGEYRGRTIKCSLYRSA